MSFYLFNFHWYKRYFGIELLKIENNENSYGDWGCLFSVEWIRENAAKPFINTIIIQLLFIKIIDYEF